MKVPDKKGGRQEGSRAAGWGQLSVPRAYASSTQLPVGFLTAVLPGTAGLGKDVGQGAGGAAARAPNGSTGAGACVSC